MAKRIDDVFPGHPTGPDEFAVRSELEQQDVASLEREQFEQQRIGGEQTAPFDKNRVPAPGTGDNAGGRARINGDHWGE